MSNVQNAGGAGGGGLTVLGKLFSVVLVLGLVGLGAWVMVARRGGGGTAATGVGPAVVFDTSDVVETAGQVRRLGPPGAYVPKNNVVEIELSKYAGYAGLIVANGGLAANEDSYFFKKHGFKVQITLSEEESWDALNGGKMAASATTADVLPVYGRQFQVVVPAQIGYSRGADGLVVREDIKKVNDLKGKVVGSCQFTESDFFIRYLAQEAGVPVKMMGDLKGEVDPGAINLIYCKDGLAAGDLFVKALAANSNAIAGCTTWAPKTSEIPTASKGKARLLVSNKNLLIVADVLIVNNGFAQKNADKVDGLVDGLLMGNKAVREGAEGSVEVVGKAFGWERNQTVEELKKVHLSNLPEQMAFFNGGISQGGSFANIYQSAYLAYGPELIPNPVDSDHFVSLNSLKAAEMTGAYKDQVAAITPIAAGPTAPTETDPVLSKDIRFFFEPNLAALDMTKKENVDNLKAIKRILDVSPGSRIILVGHVDNSKIPEFREKGGEPAVIQGARDAVDLSRRRAIEVKTQLVGREKADENRLETVGKGWTQPVSAVNPDLNRRVEVQWFTLE